MKKEKIKNLCKMSNIHIYKNGDTIDTSCGGILLRGGIKPIGHIHEENEFGPEFDITSAERRRMTAAPETKLPGLNKNLSESKKHNLSYFMQTKILK
jgi:hypothetical protein